MILIQAFDNAGNYMTDAQDFTIKALASPEITEYPHTLQSGEVLTIKGKSALESLS